MDGRLIIEDGDDPRPAGADHRQQPLGGRRQRPQGDQEGQASAGKAAVPPQPRRRSSQAQRRAPLRPRQRALRPLPRRRPAVQLRLLHRSRQQPRAGAGRQEGAYRRQARPEAGPARARHRLRLGRDGALPAQGRRASTCSASPLSEEQLKVARQRAEEAGVADQVKFELIDYRQVDGTLRPDRLDRHVRACRRGAL